MVKILLIPFGQLFGLLTWIRRELYQRGILKRTRMNVHSIVVGNLNVGGSGKTPFSLWLATRLAEDRRTAILSRGYGRKTKGFLQVTAASTAEQVGDEPMEMRLALPEDVPNFVCESRVQGIAQIAHVAPDTQVVVLDDAYQHLALKADKYVLLCDYHNPFFRDFPMPAGRLREWPCAARYASCIVVTRCPADMSPSEALEWYTRLAKYGCPVFFATYINTDPVSFPVSGAELPSGPVMALSALANNRLFYDYARKYSISRHFMYRDHHVFTAKDAESWKQHIAVSGAAAILTTRKDAMRLQPWFKELPVPVFMTFTHPEFLFEQEDEFIRRVI
ncbi:MAG: tetraacyldisaccharide 4'-kinase [Bacteroidetes bacterium]|nr:tetraacyldisaccharide 4'-kinase [Bacteroidota bacterium]